MPAVPSFLNGRKLDLLRPASRRPHEYVSPKNLKRCARPLLAIYAKTRALTNHCSPLCMAQNRHARPAWCHWQRSPAHATRTAQLQISPNFLKRCARQNATETMHCRPLGTADPDSTVKFLNQLGNWGSNAVQ